jgi:hypothetical protein
VNQAIEQIRALPFDTLKSGLLASDLTGDSNITNSGGVYKFNGVTPNETIPTHGTAAATDTAPLVPHKAMQTVGPTSANGTRFTVAAYPSYLNDNTAQYAFRVTVIVTWAGAQRGAAGRAQSSTIMYSPQGCLSTSTHPFAAPCQPFSYATAGVHGGQIGITGMVQGLSLDTTGDPAAGAFINTGEADAELQLEQVFAVQGRIQTSGGTFKPSSGTLEIAGRLAVQSRADNDASQPGNATNSSATPPAGLAASSVPAVPALYPNPLVVTTSGERSFLLATLSTVTADSTCGESPTSTNQPCATSRMQPSTTASANVTFGARASLLGTASLAQLTAPSAPATVTTQRALSPGINVCRAAAADGCVRSDASRTITQLTLGGLPANIRGAPAGFIRGYFVRVLGFADSVAAEAGSGTSSGAPSATASGTVTYWNGTTYTTLTIASGASVSIPRLSLSFYDAVNDVDVLVSADNLRTGGTSTTNTPGTASTSCVATCRLQSTATSKSPLLGTITYNITKRSTGERYANLTMAVDLGSLNASASYQGAPSAT